MSWKILFIVYVGYTLFIVPWKIRRYRNGVETSSAAVKIEEFTSAAFHLFGCAALYEGAFGVTLLSPQIWSLWLVIGVAWTLSPLLVRSPKLEHLRALAGSRTLVLALAMVVGTLVVAPLYVAVYLQSSFYPG